MTADTATGQRGAGLAVAVRIRAMREARNLTLADVADGAGLSVSALSRAETGRRELSAGDLIAIAGALRCDPREFFDRLDQESRVVPPLRVRSGGMTATAWSDRLRDVRAWDVHLSAAPEGTQRVVHDGDESIVVLEGQVDVILHGRRTYRVGPGRAFRIRATHGHEVVAANDSPARLLWLLTDEGEQEHLELFQASDMRI